jgi:hypothetical protein
MALDLRDTTKFPRTATTAATAANLVEIQIPIQAGKISISSESNAVYVFGYDGLADNASTPVTNYQFIPQDNILEMLVGRGSTRRTSIFVAMKTGSGTISVMVEEV